MDAEKNVKIEFFTNSEPLLASTDIHPKPSKSYIPQWFKDIPSHASLNNNFEDTVYPSVRSIKTCPAIPDFFSQGYIVPMWADTTLKYVKEDDTWWYRCGIMESNSYKIEPHGNQQYLDHAPANFLGNAADFVFKFVCPWQLRTPPGYSVFQIPLFYHFIDDFSVMPGVIDTDIWHDIHQQVVYHGKGKEIFIPRGTPLVQYIPFKREKQDLSVNFYTEEFKLAVDKNLLLKESMFEGPYKHLKRERDR